MIEFEEFPKIPRLNRSMVVTEKIDGSNAAIIFDERTPFGIKFAVQSRKRLISPGKSSDMAGLAAWVTENREELYELLGPGRHFGEWYGHGIQRGYGLDHKRFALFNSDRWEPVIGSAPAFFGEHAIHTVPVLFRGMFDSNYVSAWIIPELRDKGSHIPGAEGFAAEGAVVWHNAARQLFKVTVDNDERPKGSQEAA